ncbi:MAG TPA: hypothetical protein VFA74_05695 [Terriglobales bacterium]|nr:hypothetical protein [Terriglobales bacterium]
MSQAHIKGINWEIIHELLIAEYERVKADTTGSPEARQWMLDELNRMNDIAVEKAERQE